MKRLKRHRRGVTIIYVAITIVVLLGMMGLALDTARVYLVAHELQNAADAASLAGAEWVQLDTTQARNAAMNVASMNHAEGVSITLADNPGNTAGAQIVIGYYNRTARTFTVTLTNPNAMQVRARRTADQNGALPLIFGPWFNPNATFSNVERSAIAMFGDKNPGVIVLNQHLPSSMDFNGIGSQPKITVNLVDASGNSLGEEGAVIVNSDSPSGFTWTGNPTMQVQDLYLGGSEASAQNMLPASANLHLNEPPTPDPLAALYSGFPTKPATQSTKNASTGVWTAGYYPNGVPGGAVLGPGLHWIDGGISGAITAAQGSLIYVNTGDVSIGGNDVLQVRRITDPSSPYAQWTSLGISLWIKSGNLTMKGTSDIDNDGVLYLTGQAPSGGLASLTGTPTSVGSMLITDRLSITGTGVINVKHSPDPSKFKHVFLVQ